MRRITAMLLIIMVGGIAVAYEPADFDSMRDQFMALRMCLAIIIVQIGNILFLVEQHDITPQLRDEIAQAYQTFQKALDLLRVSSDG